MDRRFLLALSVLILTTVLGCGSKVTRENYDKIKGGMTVAEVEALLGPGKEEQTPAHIPNAKALSWSSGNARIDVEFRDGKVYGHGFGQGNRPPQ